MTEDDWRRRAVSDVISFTLVFALITATIGIVYVSGFTGLQNTRDAERITNAERAFDVLADNINDIHSEAAPSRATEIKLADAQLEFGESTRVTIDIVNYDGSGENVSSVSLDPIVYSGSSSEVYYENGAVFRVDRSGATMNRQPSILFSTDSNEKTVVFPTIETRVDGPASTGSQRTVLVRTLLATREVTVAETDPTAVTDDNTGHGTDPDNDGSPEFKAEIQIETSPQRASRWKEYLDSEIPDTDAGGNDFALNDPPCELLDLDSDGEDETVQCVVAAERVYSSATRIDVIYD